MTEDINERLMELARGFAATHGLTERDALRMLKRHLEADMPPIRAFGSMPPSTETPA